MTVINGIPENQNNGKTHKYSGIEWYSLKNRKGILCRNWATNGCTREMVRIVLKKHGVPKRNKWEGHISLDPRYYKCVK